MTIERGGGTATPGGNVPQLPSINAGDALDRLQVKADESAYELYTPTADNPAIASGDALKRSRVNAGETVYELYVPTPDTPAIVSGDALKVVRVNAGETAYELVTSGVKKYARALAGGVFNGIGGPAILRYIVLSTDQVAAAAFTTPEPTADFSNKMLWAGTVAAVELEITGNDTTQTTTFTVRVNGVDTSMVGTLAATTDGVVALSGTAAFTAGDIVTLEASLPAGGSKTGWNSSIVMISLLPA